MLIKKIRKSIAFNCHIHSTDEDLKVSIGDLFAAGSETTSSTLRWFVLLMATHPEEQKKAQDEMDKIIPRFQIPTLQDKDK